MKWVSFLVAVLIAVLVVLPTAVLAESDKPVEIQSISHDVGPDNTERVSFILSGSAAPSMFTLGGGNPRLVVDFSNSRYAGDINMVLDSGTLATAIRVGFHQKPEQKTRVVIDLAKDFGVIYTSTKAEKDSVLVITLERENTTAKAKTPVTQPEIENIAEDASQDNLAAKPLDEKPIPPVFAQKPETESVSDQTEPHTGPQLLSITFDDSSNRGEMVLFHLNDFFPPIVSAVEKSKPRVICDFMDLRLGEDVQNSIVAGGKYVDSIDVEEHSQPNKISVQLNLTPDRDYDLQQVFFKNDNLFVLIVNELAPEEKTTNQ